MLVSRRHLWHDINDASAEVKVDESDLIHVRLRALFPDIIFKKEVWKS